MKWFWRALGAVAVAIIGGTVGIWLLTWALIQLLGGR